jgi:hypothetical protein
MRVGGCDVAARSHKLRYLVDEWARERKKQRISRERLTLEDLGRWRVLVEKR